MIVTIKPPNKHLDRLLPEMTCMYCGTELFDFDRYGLCRVCLDEMEYNNGNVCRKCGSPLPLGAENIYCGDCNDKTHFSVSRSVVIFDSISRKYILDLKLNYRKRAALLMGRLMADKFAVLGWTPDAVTTVPVYNPNGKRFDHVRNIAEVFCLDTGLPLYDGIVKIAKRRGQEGLTPKERLENVHRTFSVKDRADFKGKSVLLLDDVKTSGATIDECARVLKSAGAIDVRALTFATPQVKRI